MQAFNSLKNRLRALVRRHADIDEVEIVFALLRHGSKSRRMLDVGAHRGSSLEGFAEAGWEVHAFEPDANNFEVLEQKWGARPNVRLDRRAVSRADEKGIAFFPSESNSYISSLARFDPSHPETSCCVDAVTLATYCREHAITEAGFLKIDAEGYDLFVLQGCPWECLNPEVILCEYENRKTEPLGYSVDDLAALLSSHGYRILVSEWFPIIQYSGPFRWRRFAEWRSGLVDPAGNGNLIAVRDPVLFSRLKSVCRRRVMKKNALDFLTRLYSRF